MNKLSEDEMMEVFEETCLELFPDDKESTSKLKRRFSELINEKFKLKEAEKEQNTSPKPEKKLIVAVHDPDGNLMQGAVDAYIIQMEPSIRRPGAGEAEFAPETWEPAELAARLEEFFSIVRYGKKGWKFQHFGDYMESGNRQEAKRWGLNIKTKLPVLCLPVAPKIPRVISDDSKEITKDINVIIKPDNES